MAAYGGASVGETGSGRGRALLEFARDLLDLVDRCVGFQTHLLESLVRADVRLDLVGPVDDVLAEGALHVHDTVVGLVGEVQNRKGAPYAAVTSRERQHANGD